MISTSSTTPNLEEPQEMNNTSFWEFFNAIAYPQLAHRKDSLKHVFEHLDSLNRAVFIVETGCVRNAGTWAGEGQSTVLFDHFVASLPGSVMHSVDLDPQATALCRSLVSERVQVHTSDSVAFLRTLAANPPQGFEHLDVLYLDSYDVDWSAPHPSALHHMKELLAIAPLVGPGTLVVVDDAPLEAMLIPNNDGIAFVSSPQISGKGKYVADYAQNIGIKPVFSGYQVGYKGF